MVELSTDTLRLEMYGDITVSVSNHYLTLQYRDENGDLHTSGLKRDEIKLLVDALEANPNKDFRALYEVLTDE